MAYKFRIQFLPDEAVEFWRDKRSIRIVSPSTGEAFTPEQSVHFYRALLQYLKDVQNEADTQLADEPKVLQASDFSDLSHEPFFKYVSARTWEYIRRGSFQFGSAEYYRRVENPNIKDWREGLSMVQLVDGGHQCTIFLRVGFNCAIFCGTSQINGVDHDRMMAQFGGAGGKCLQIKRAPEFMAQVKKRMRAFRTRAHDVVYNNKIFSMNGAEASHIRSLMMTDPFSLPNFNRQYFGMLYDIGLLPSLFIKPVSYAHERERRMVFELRDNLVAPTQVVRDRELLDFIDVVDAYGGDQSN